MKVISKILTILAALVLVGASVLFLIDKSDLAASLGYYANDMVAFVKDKDNRIIIVAYGAINLVLAFIYAIRRRKNKNTFNIIFLVIDLVIAFLLVVFKDKIKGIADLSTLTKVSVYMVLGAVALLFIAALIPGKKKEKTPFSYKPLGLLPYVIAIIGCVAVIVYAVVAKNGLESFGKLIRDTKDYMFNFDENWVKPRPRNVIIGVSGAIVVVFSILILIRRKRNVLPALYVGAGLSILFVYLMKSEYVVNYIKRSVADESLTNNILVMGMLFAILLVELVAVFSFAEVLISFFDNDQAASYEQVEDHQEQTAEVKALVEDINNDEEETEEEETQYEVSEDIETEEASEEAEDEDMDSPSDEEIDVDDIDDEEDEDDDDDDDEESDEDEDEDEDEDDDDDDNDDGAREALRRRRELIRQRILAARAESDDEEEEEEAEEDEIVGYEDEEDEEDSEDEDIEEDDEAEPEDIIEQEALSNGEEIPSDDEEYEDDDEQSDAYEESIAFDNEEDEEEDNEEDEIEFEDDTEEEFDGEEDDEEFDDEDSDDSSTEGEEVSSITGSKIPKIKSKPLDEKMVTVLDDEKKQRYNTIRNALQSYKKVSERLSSKGDSYRFHRDLIAKMTISGKTLRLHLALNPEDFEGTKYSYQDLSAKHKYMYIPMTVKLRSNRSVKQALELIEMLAQTFGLEKNSRYKEKDYIKDLETAYYARQAETESNDNE